MPRPPQQQQARRRSTSRQVSGSFGASPFKSPVKIPLNDDAEEKARRSHGRKALHEAQINQLKAAATGTPARKGTPLGDLDNNLGSSPISSPRTPARSNNNGSVNNTHRRRSGKENSIIIDDEDRFVVGGAAVTPMKRVPILANFEEWMKMATDNKINATNSWNFALIDYFHDLSLLKEGDGVNFQKASCTLDGCVKIYTSRVDSVATETNRLLTGLADSRDSKKKNSEGEDGEGEDEEDEVDEDGNVRKKARKKTQRSSEATLAPSFASLQLKKLELEFAVDPLFKKASADFDEGGAKGLLLNHLMIDSQGRIVFDSSDDANDTAATSSSKTTKRRNEATRAADEDGDVDMDASLAETEPEEATPQPEEDDEDVEIDVASLGARFFPDLSRLDGMDVCPSLKTYDLGDPSGSLDIPFLRAPDYNDKEKTPGPGDKSGMFIDEENPLGFDDDVDGLGAFDLGADVDFGEGGEAWAREAALEPQMMRVFDAGLGDGLPAGEGEDGDNIDLLGPANHPGGGVGGVGDFVVSMANQNQHLHEDILGYFDQALQKNWTSAEHWRIRKIKDVNKPVEPARQRKEKQPFEIDFMSALDPAVAEVIYTQASSNTAISLPKKDWKSKSRNLLPDDKHFSSRQLLSLFLKPKARMGARRRLGASKGGIFGTSHHDGNGNQLPEGEMDEAFWASQKAPNHLPDSGSRSGSHDPSDDTGLPQGDYDANFFQDGDLPFAGGDDDDDDMDDEFADAREHFSPDLPGGMGMGGNGMMTEVGMTGAFGGLTVTNPADLAFGTMLVTQSRRVRPEYVAYARVAKKVDIRKLKEEIWKGMDLERLEKDREEQNARLPTPSLSPEKARDQTTQQEGQVQDEGGPTLKFTNLVNNLKSVYPKPMMDDISTSYAFICVLHLANEKGLIIEKTPELTELTIRKDWNAVVTEGE